MLVPNIRDEASRQRDTGSSTVRKIATSGEQFAKTNQTINSNSIPNAEPINIELLHTKNPEPVTVHPPHDPVCMR